MIRVCLGTAFSQSLYHIETSQFICDAYRMTGFWMVRVFAERCLRTDIYYLRQCYYTTLLYWYQNADMKMLLT